MGRKPSTRGNISLKDKVLYLNKPFWRITDIVNYFSVNYRTAKKVFDKVQMIGGDCPFSDNLIKSSVLFEKIIGQSIDDELRTLKESINVLYSDVN